MSSPPTEPEDAAAGGRVGRWYRDSLVGHPVGRDFRRLWAGDTVSQLGTQVGGIALPLLAVTVLGADELQMGLLATFENIAFLLVGLPAGAWVDRLLKRRVLVTGDLVRALALLTLPAAYVLDVLTFPLLLVVATVTGVATVFFDVAYQSYLPSLVPSSRISEGNARLQVSQSAAAVVGPAVGGVLVRAVGAPFVLLVDALSFLLSALLLGRIRHRETPPSREGRRPLRTEIGEGLSFVARQPLLRRIVATTATSNFASNLGGGLLVLYVVRDLGITAAELGIAFSVGAVGGLVGAFASGTVMRVLGEGRTIALAIVPSSAAAALVPLTAGQDTTTALAMIAVSFAVYGFSVVVYNVAQVSFRQRLCPRPLLGRMNASVRFVIWGVSPIGAFVGGIIGSERGILTALWIGVAIEVLAVFPVLLSPLLRMRDLPRHLDEHAEDPAAG